MNPELVRHILQDESIISRLGEGKWRRTYGRLSSDGAVLLYENDAGPSSAVAVSVSAGLETVLVRPWVEDPALPALSGLIARHAKAVPVRYRPGKRCTLRKGNLFLKCVADDRGCAINRDARLLWAGQQRGQLEFGVARPAGWLPRQRLMLQHRVSGKPIIDQLASATGAALALRMGRANASLAASNIVPSVRFTYADQLRRTAKYARRLARYLPETTPLLACLSRQLERVDAGDADRPIHGAPHAHQWLDGPEGLKLVDFDRFALGDPELDVATFVAEADFEDASNADAAGQLYLQGFAERWPIRLDLVKAYRLHKHVAKALRTATAIRLDAAERTFEILNRAVEMAEKQV